MKSESGQGSLELITVSFLIIALVKSCLFLFWILNTQFWIEHQLYQGLICRAEQREKSLCTEKILKNIQQLNPFGTLEDLKIDGSYRKWKGSILWKIYIWDLPIQSTLFLKN